MYTGDSEICTICMADNGFVVKMKDVEGETAAAKKRAKTDKYVPTPEPDVLIATSMGALMKMLKEKLPKLASETEEYSEGFAEASAAAPKSKY